MTTLASNPLLVDRHGRVHTNLRLSVTDKCSLRCTYCMPANGLPWLPRSELLIDDEIVRLVRVAVGLGIASIRVTGGEPLIRRGITGLIARLLCAACDRVRLTEDGPVRILLWP
jgi:GTP 3',8-cyclase